MEAFLKRKFDQEGNGGQETRKQKRDVCPHGVKCYRKNPHHFREFDHPHLLNMFDGIPEGLPQDKSVYEAQVEILKPLLKAKASTGSSTSSSSGSSAGCSSSTSQNIARKPTKEALAPAGTMLAKLQKAAPYNLFFTTIPKSEKTLKDPNSITFTDLLCPSLGTLKCSLQINFMIDIGWLVEQYKKRGLHQKPMTILYGDDWPDMKEFMDKFLPNVTYHLVRMKDPFGCHHSKIGIYNYDDDSIRVVVSTANLYMEDWNHYNQGLWISPRCRPLDSGGEKDGESPTNFKSSLLTYLKHYNLPMLIPWIARLKTIDFSAIQVCLVTSVPGKHYPQSEGSHVHRVADLLSKHCQLPKKEEGGEGPLDWGVVAQSSSLGSMGKSAGEWLRGTLLRSLSAHKNAQPTANSGATLSLVFPSVDNVAGGFWGLESGGCLPYSKAVNEKQRWLQSYLHQWKADSTGRTRAMPHIKSYCRLSPNLSKLAWFLITSANISKSAWGSNLQKDLGTYVRSYEVGVLFLPHFFSEEFLEIAQTMNSKNQKVFPFMYDLPLTEYKSSDYPWCN